MVEQSPDWGMSVSLRVALTYAAPPGVSPGGARMCAPWQNRQSESLTRWGWG